MKDTIAAVYGHGSECLGFDFEAIMGAISKGTSAVTQVISAGKTLLGPTAKAQANTITGGSALPIGPYDNIAVKKPFPIVPVAIGAGVLLLVVAVVILKKK
jgi:hypothetical protein